MRVLHINRSHIERTESMGKVVFKNDKVMVIEKHSTEYEVLKYGVRNMDGILHEDWHYYATYTDTYTRDFLGRTYSLHYNTENIKGYGYTRAIECARDLSKAI